MATVEINIRVHVDWDVKFVTPSNMENANTIAQDVVNYELAGEINKLRPMTDLSALSKQWAAMASREIVEHEWPDADWNTLRARVKPKVHINYRLT